MDSSPTRRGRPAWYVSSGLGPAAFNDSLLLKAAIYKVLERRFGRHECYTKIVKEFHDVVQRTAVGQSIDLLTSKERSNIPAKCKVDI